MVKMFPVIDLVATGENIVRLRKARGLTVRDLQNWFGFEEPQAIYKWQKGKSLPTVDNLYALGALLDVSIEEILVPCKPQLHMAQSGQQEVSCCPSNLIKQPYWLWNILGNDRNKRACHQFVRQSFGVVA
ncbi:MAG: helix-turn-helix transcriptional regulator [Oscillospiraceae bacterium]|nr:helix-turn-helix transcriptional regulator [Oscillospiraceae bacterium]